MEVTIYGKTLNDSYMHILYDHQDLDLQTVYLLDRIQKGLPVEKRCRQIARPETGRGQDDELVPVGISG